MTKQINKIFLTSNKLTFFSDFLEYTSYRTKHLKSIFAFTEVDLFDICFFAFYVKEFKSYYPNQDKTYIFKLDSVDF